MSEKRGIPVPRFYLLVPEPDNCNDTETDAQTPRRD